MAAPQTPQAGPNGQPAPRRPRAWLARRMAAVLSVAAMLGLGGLMYWNDQQGTAGATQATAAAEQSTTNPSASAYTRERGEGDDEHESDDDDEHEHESDDDDDDSSIVEDIASLIPGLSDSSSSSNSTSNGGSQQQSVPAPHTDTRGS